MSEAKDQGTWGTRQATSDATSTDERELARIERRLHVCWRDLAAAEQRGLPEHLLEHMYANYLRLLDAYVATQHQLRGRAPLSRLAS